MHKLADIFEGWDGYQISLVHAVALLTSEQLNWRPSPHQRSVGEVFRHVAVGRINWMARISAPKIQGAVAAIPEWFTDDDGARHVVEESIACDAAGVLGEWLERSWVPIQKALQDWTVESLSEAYPHRFRGTDYRVSRQWVLWRVLSHDIHHGGQLATMLGMQNIEAFELRALGGHITVPLLAKAHG